MAVKKTIAIIGATGDMGTAIAKALIQSSYRILLMARDKNKLAKLSATLKRKTPTAEVAVIECEKEACWEADVIILAVPYEIEKEVAEKIKEVTTQKVVISISNPLNKTFDGLVTPTETSAAEELQKVLPHSKVVKAFNTIFAADLACPDNTAKAPDTCIAGNDAEALQTVSDMATALGYQPVIAGDLTASRRMEQMILPLLELKMEENFNLLSGWDLHHHSSVNFKSIIK